MKRQKRNALLIAAILLVGAVFACYISRQPKDMKTTLKSLLDSLDAVSATSAEVTDTDVRERMYQAVYHGFIIQTADYALPSEFGMFQPAGNSAVRAALADFLPAARTVAHDTGLSAPQQRFEAFQDGSVLSTVGNPYDEYFGHADSLEQLSAATELHKPAK